MKYIVIITGFICIFALALPALTIHVPEDQPTIQAGIDAAADGDTVLIASGTYTGDGNRDIEIFEKSLVVMSEEGPEFTVVDCEADSLDMHDGFYFYNAQDPDTRLEGLTIRNGYHDYAGGVGLQGSHPTISNCIIEGNTARKAGGGICCSSSNAEFVNCRIEGNTAGYNGGGLYCIGDSYATFRNCVITENTSSSDYGGGIYCVSPQLIITDCMISGNWTWLGGGGIYLYSSHLIITRSCIEGNTAVVGGGGIEVADNLTMTNCSVIGNTTQGDGGGISCGGTDIVIENCIIAQNIAEIDAGGIIMYWSDPIITNCVMTDNVADENGGAICCWYSSPVITNCILWNDSPEEIRVFGGDPLSVTYSDIQGGCEGEGNIDLDPRFVHFPIRGFEYLLRPDSHCIDAGDPSIEDGLYDWHPRWPEWYPDGARSDMGAYGGPGNRDWLE